MPSRILQSKLVRLNSPLTSTQVAFDAPLTAGSSLVVAVAWYGNPARSPSTLGSVADNKGNSYVKRVGAHRQPSADPSWAGDLWVEIHDCLNAADPSPGTPVQITLAAHSSTGTNNSVFGCVMEVAGITGAIGSSVATGGDENSTSATATIPTLDVAPSWGVGICGGFEAITGSPSGWDVVGSPTGTGHIYGTVVEREIAGSGPQSLTWQYGTALYGAAAVATLYYAGAVSITPVLSNAGVSGRAPAEVFPQVNLTFPEPPPQGGSLSPGDGIYQLGDSTTYGHNSINGNQVAIPAPKALETELDGVYPVTFEGVGLATTSDLLAGTGGYSAKLDVLLATSPAKVVIYPFGINDSYLISDEQFEANLRAIVTTTRSAGKFPILQTPNPTNQNLSAELEIIRGVSSSMGVPLIDVYAYLTDQLGGVPVTTMMPDGTHPSQTTYLLIGKYQAGRFKDIFSVGEAPPPDPDPDPDPPDPYPPGGWLERPFRADSAWNTPIPANAIWRGPSDPRTETIRRNYGGGSHYDGSPTNFQWALNLWDYTIYVWYAVATDPLVTIHQGGQQFVIRCPAGAIPSTGTDMHMCVVDPDQLHSHDMWGAQRVSANRINAASYVKTRLDGHGWRMVEERLQSGSNPRGLNPENASAGGGGPRAVSAASLGGLIRAGELERGVIEHALVFATPRRWANGRFGVRVHPANWISLGDGDESSGRWEPFTGTIRYSDRFGLSQSLNVDALPLSREWKIVLKALQIYGMYMGDVAGENTPCIYAEWPAVENRYGRAMKDQQAQAFSYIRPNLFALDWY